MTVLSSRFAGPAIALLVPCAAVVWFHALAAPTHDPCADAAAFFASPRIAGAETAAWEDLPAGSEGVRARLLSAEHPPLYARVLRTTEPSPLYGSPIQLGLNERLYLRAMPVRHLEAGDDVLPVHWGATLEGGTAFVESYFYAQSGMPIRHPLQTALVLGPSQLAGGTRPLYVFIVAGKGSPEALPDLERAAERWLVAAWRELEAACGR